MAKQQVTLKTIVDVGGTVYGPGTVLVDQRIAKRLIEYHEGVAGQVVEASIEELLRLPVSELSQEQMELVMAHKRGLPTPQAPTTAAATPAAPTQTPHATGESFQGEPYIPGTPPQPQHAHPEPFPEDHARTERREQFLALSDEELMETAIKHNVPITTEMSGDRTAIASMLASDDQVPPPTPQQEPSANQLPKDFPARDKLAANGFLTTEQLQTAKPEDWGKDLTQTDKDKVLAELALLKA